MAPFGVKSLPTYRMTMDEAKARYADPVPVEGSLEVRRTDENGSRARARNRCTYVSPARLAAARG
jgi:hypothetical protein